MNPIPILYRDRELLFDPDILEKMIFLNMRAGKIENNLKRFSDIINQALSEFFDTKFPELKIERYIDVEAEASQKRFEKMQEEQSQEKENRRLLQLAKKRIIEREIEKIKKEEEKSGKKTELPDDIGRILGNYKI